MTDGATRTGETIHATRLVDQDILNSLFCGSVKLIDLPSQTASHTPSLHRHTAQCWRQIGRRVRRDILCGEPVIAVSLLVRKLFHRLAAGLRGRPC